LLKKHQEFTNLHNRLEQSRGQHKVEMKEYMKTDEYQHYIIPLFRRLNVDQKILSKLFNYENVTQRDIENLFKALPRSKDQLQRIQLSPDDENALKNFSIKFDLVLKDEMPQLDRSLEKYVHDLRSLPPEKLENFFYNLAGEIKDYMLRNPQTTFFIFLLSLILVGIFLNASHSKTLKKIGVDMMITSIAVLAVWGIGKFCMNLSNSACIGELLNI